MRNPFVIQRDIIYGEPFCDREEEIKRYLSAARMGESLCLISPRRYGKTSLLNQVAGKLEAQGWLTAKIDCMQTLSDVELAKEVERTRLGLLGTWRRAAHKLGQTVQDHKQTRIDFDLEDIHFSLGLGGPEETNGRTLLRGSLSRLREFPEKTGTSLMVYIDEFQRMREMAPEGNLEAMIRAVFQKRTEKFLPMYLGSRRHMLKMMFADKSAPLFKSATILSLDTIRDTSFAIFANRQFKQTLKAHLPDNLAVSMCRFFQGHPHLLNRTSALIWDTCLRDRIRTVTKKICIAAILTVVREETDAFLEFNRKTPLKQIEVLRQIAIRGTVPKPYAMEFLRICNISQSQMQKIIAALVEDDRIHRDDSGIRILDPLEGLALKMIGRGMEWRFEMIENFLNEAEVGIESGR